MVQSASDAGVAIVGAGALGQAYAAQLARGGVPTTLLARAASALTLVEAGGIRLSGVLDLHVAVRTREQPEQVDAAPSVTVVTDATSIPPGAGVVFATKAHQLHAAVQQVRAAQRQVPAWVLGVQNGLQKDSVLEAAFGSERVVGAATIMSAQHAPNGGIVMTALGPTYLGDLDTRGAQRADAAAELLSAAGVQVQRELDVRRVLWSKACNAAGVFGVCVLARCSGVRMSGSPELVRAYLTIVREVASVAKTYGVTLGDFPGFPMRTYVERSDDETIAFLGEQVQQLRARGAPENYPSMVQDVLAGRPMEVEGVFGDLVERGERVGVPTPALRFATQLLRGIDATVAPTSYAPPPAQLAG